VRDDERQLTSPAGSQAVPGEHGNAVRGEQQPFTGSSPSGCDHDVALR